MTWHRYSSAHIPINNFRNDFAPLLKTKQTNQQTINNKMIRTYIMILPMNQTNFHSRSFIYRITITIQHENTCIIHAAKVNITYKLPFPRLIAIIAEFRADCEVGVNYRLVFVHKYTCSDVDIWCKPFIRIKFVIC